MLFTVLSTLLLSVWRYYLRTPGVGKNIYLKNNACVEKKIKISVDDRGFNSYRMKNVLILSTREAVREQSKSLKGDKWCFVFIIKKFSVTVYKEPYFLISK